MLSITTQAQACESTDLQALASQASHPATDNQAQISAIMDAALAMLVKAMGGPQPPPFNLTLINVGACNFKEGSARGAGGSARRPGPLPPALSRLLQGPPAAAQLAHAPASGAAL